MYDLFDNGPENELDPFASIMAHDHASEWSTLDPAGFTGLLPPQATPSRLDDFDTFESAAEIMRTDVYSPAFPLIARDDFLLSSLDAAKPGPTYGALATHSDDGATEVEEVVITA